MGESVAIMPNRAAFAGDLAVVLAVVAGLLLGTFFLWHYFNEIHGRPKAQAVEAFLLAPIVVPALIWSCIRIARYALVHLPLLTVSRDGIASPSWGFIPWADVLDVRVGTYRVAKDKPTEPAVIIKVAHMETYMRRKPVALRLLMWPTPVEKLVICLVDSHFVLSAAEAKGIIDRFRPLPSPVAATP